MTHTNTEQPEALRLSSLALDNKRGILSFSERVEIASQLKRLHARVQELEAQTAHMADLVELADYATKKLEASQAQREPLTRKQINECSRDAQIAFCLDKQSTYEVALTREVERRHGITQEKQG